MAVFLLALVLLTSLTALSLRDLTFTSRLVDHSKEQIVQIEATISALKDAESGQRGYLLTGGPEYLAPYTTALAETADHLARIRALSVSDPVEAQSARQLDGLIMAKLAELRRSIELYDTRGPSAAVALVETGRGRRLMEAIRANANRMERLARAQLGERTARSESAARWTAGTMAGGAVILGILFLLLRTQIRIHLTRRRVAERELARSHHRQNEILETIRDGFLSIDRGWRLTYLNRRAEELLARPRTELLGGNPLETLALEPDVVDRIRASMDRRETMHFETYSAAFARWHEVFLHPVEEGLTVVFRDITRRKKTEEAILEAQRQLQIALNAARMGAWSWNIRTGALDWSQNLGEIHGVAPGTFGGTYDAFLACIHPEDRQRVDDQVRRAVQERSVYDVEFRVPFPDGSTHWVAGHGQVFVDETGNPARMIGLGMDVTERRRGEEERERLFREAEDAIQMRDAFLSVAGHEFRTPLGALSLMLQNLDRRARKQEDATLSERLQAPMRQVDRLVRLTNELLEVGRINSGRLALDVESMDLSALAAEVVDRLEEPARRAGSSIVLRGSDPVVGSWDRSRMDQVLTNLLTNALKFGAGSPVEIGIAGRNGTAIVTVRDRGIGISAEDQQRIFQRFERAVSERSYSGIGLGLWIARQIVDAHGGRIGVDSVPGEGAEFRVELPVHPAVPQPAANVS